MPPTALQPDALRQRIARDQLDGLFNLFSTGVIGAALAAVVLVVTLRFNDAVDPRIGLVWALVIITLAGAHLLLGVLYRRSGELRRRSPIWPTLFTLCAFGEGAGWGWATVMLPIDGRFDHQLIVLLVALSVAAGAVAAFGAYLPAFVAIFVPATFPYVFASFSAANRLEATSWPLMIVYMFSVLGLGMTSNRASCRSIELRLLSEALAADLQCQKEIAETANRAKSTFLAAASHDLRQPVHALGLFVGALRGLDLPPEGHHLATRIEASVEALDGLFGALLDISRLDAGVVEVDVRTFPIGLLIERICSDHLAEATAKGLSIRFRPCALFVDSDPVLLERILRNLIANAVRYTTHGRVFIACRRRGATVVVEVRDSGPGIAPVEQARIFEEYYQVGNLERDRTNGLGLGLAIVRRLAALLGSTVTLRSAPGRGTSFAIDLPLAGTSATLPAPVHGHADPDTGLVVFVDDERDIREAMFELLSHWGYTVITASSGDDALARLADCPTQPRLLICDYRLRHGENGIDVVARLRAEYNEPIAAMLITGDTAPLRLIEARASGLALLHKPVSNVQLRAAIATVLAGTGHQTPG